MSAPPLNPLLRAEWLCRQTYLTPQQAAEYLQITVNGFRKFAHKAALPACRMGRRVLYLRRDIDDTVQPAHVRKATR